MTQQQPPDAPTTGGTPVVLKITEANTQSSHVDDLLRRQASLRGDTGIARDRGGRWFYKSWFVLLFAGLLGALLGWGIIEPAYNDQPYVEGEIRELEKSGGPGEPEFIAGSLTIGNIRYLLVEESRQRKGNGPWEPLDMETLRNGERIGVYVEIPQEQETKDLAHLIKLAAYVVRDVPPSNATSDLMASQRKHSLMGLLLFPLVAGCIGLFIGAADGIMCRQPRRIFLAGGIGLIVGLVGGFLCTMCANQVYSPIAQWASHQEGGGAFGLSTTGFLAQVGGRSLAWALAGVAMGLGQGLALRSGKLLLYGFLGGLIGGLLGGLLFDPIFLLLSYSDPSSAHLSRMISLGIIGISVGVMIGVVELLARDAWLRMTAGPLAGKEFLMFKNTMNVGASPKSDIYLFNDAGVAPTHAVIRATADAYEVESASDVYPVTVNGRAVQRTRLRHGDQIGLGRTVFVFQRKRG